MSNAIENVLHELVELAAGRQARLTDARADELHEAITPGYNDKPLSDEERAQLAALEARRQQFSSEGSGETAAPAPPAANQAPEPASPPALVPAPVINTDADGA